VSEKRPPIKLRLDPNCGFCGQRFDARGLKSHERGCAGGSGRYRILAVTGYRITPRARGTETNLAPSTMYAVLDSANQWQEVGWFEPIGKSSEYCRRNAEILCRRLNREDAEVTAA
jgi:hypothetical protein